MATAPQVSVAKGQDPHAVTLKSLSRMDPAPINGRRILIKPRASRPLPPQSGSSTHPGVIEAAIDWFRQNRAESITVAGCPPLGICTEKAFPPSLIDLCGQKNIPLVNIDHHSVIWLDILDGTHLDRVTTSGVLVDYDFIVSMPTMSTSPYSGVALSIENLTGLAARHHKLFFEPLIRINGRGGAVYREELIADLARVLYPDMAIIDGMPALPDDTSSPDVGLVIAGPDALAVDEAACRLMGCSPSEALHLSLVSRWRSGRWDSAFIRPGRPSAGGDASNQPVLEIINNMGCTSCQNAVYRFLERHYTQLELTGNMRLAIGPEVPQCPAGTYYVGNCAAARDIDESGYHCNGCPPQEGQIWEMVQKTHPAVPAR